MKELKGKKFKMSQVFLGDGTVVPVTLVKVTQIPEDINIEKFIQVTGVSKGKGFAGVMKRWGFKGGPATHGQSDRARAPGSIGGTTSPGRVYKGKKMPGRYGGGRVTIRGLKIVDIDKKNNIVAILGAIPGARNSEVVIRVMGGRK